MLLALSWHYRGEPNDHNVCAAGHCSRCLTTLCLQVVPRSNLQLISVACMLVASKHEEERHPSVQDFTSIADNCFLTGDLLRMESAVLQCLSFRMNVPTSHTFLTLFLQGVTLSPKAQAVASYLTVSGIPTALCCMHQYFAHHNTDSKTTLILILWSDFFQMHSTSLLIHSAATCTQRAEKQHKLLLILKRRAALSPCCFSASPSSLALQGTMC